MTGVKERTVIYRHDGVELTGRLALPAGVPRAVVLVVPTIFGPTPLMWERAEALAVHGYAAMVADFYGANGPDQGDMAAVRAAADALSADSRFYRDRFLAALNALRSQPGFGEFSAFAIGYCMGGQVVLELARDGAELDGVVSFHGLLDTKAPAQQRTVQARILVCHGHRDPMVPPEQVRAFQDEMDAAKADWHMHIYARAKHGFTDPASDARGLPAIAYDHSAHRQSWAAALSFLDEMSDSGDRDLPE